MGPPPVSSSSWLLFTCKTIINEQNAIPSHQPHSQIEYIILALLLKYSALQALFIAYIGGTVLFSIQLFVPDCQYSALHHPPLLIFPPVSLVYMLSTISGFTDFAFPLLALYGKQYLYAVAGFAHFVRLIP
jgi:hypothetical protein